MGNLNDKFFMKNMKFQEMSKEALLKQKKMIEFVTGIFVGVLLALSIFTVYSYVKQGSTTLFAIPFALVPILFLNVGNWQAIKKELNSRV
ncbi:hypothetical protein GCM10028816_13580 [Spirosoma lituiforme]